MKIAISGKGGAGKTVVAANLARLFAGRGYKVYAVDADPDSCLGRAIGISDAVLDTIRPLIDMQQLIAGRGGSGAFYTLNPQVNDILDAYTVQQGNIHFLRMGGVKQGGSACYCRENSFLRAIIDALLLDKRDVVVLDMGAGIEHLTRGTAKGVDIMLVIAEPSKNSVQTARVITRLAGDLGVGKVKIIGNKIRDEKEALFLQAEFAAAEIIGLLPFSEAILAAAMSGPVDATDGSRPPGEQLRLIFDRILREC